MSPLPRATFDELGQKNWNYAIRQFETPSRSTVFFCDFLEERQLMKPGDHLVDFGAGAGAVIHYMARRYPEIRFTGLELNREMVDYGNKRFRDDHLDDRCRLIQGDCYYPDKGLLGDLDGIISIHTIMFLNDIEAFINAVASLQPKWFATNSLFYDGMVDAFVEIHDYMDALKSGGHTIRPYNFFSIPRIRESFERRGYPVFQSMPFEIDIDLPKRNDGGMGTYTEKLENGKRLQISGPLIVSWYFLYASK
ncbi:MAG TPA: class I SAM-dependent methyltransferase [bacterium]|nr:class I SAM-dependent methyltransferase [bacterium]HPO08058.1 class I SAM-dependent methyltransferase [bacterium]HQQ00518.1 class I SAM-dependent methyltransferase [bacterium]